MSDAIKGKGGLGSVLVGAALGTAAVTLMNKSSRQKVKDSIKNALDSGDKKLDELKDKANTLKKSVRNKAIKEFNKTQKKIT